jgi:hypothetical protein
MLFKKERGREREREEEEEVLGMPEVSVIPSSEF